MTKLFLLIPIFCFIFVNYNYSQLLFEENFNYPAGDSIAANGWLTQSVSSPSNPISILPMN